VTVNYEGYLSVKLVHDSQLYLIESIIIPKEEDVWIKVYQLVNNSNAYKSSQSMLHRLLFVETVP